MSKEVIVRKIYPKLRGNFVSYLDQDGFKLAKNKSGAIYFKQNEECTSDELKHKIDKFLELGQSFGLMFTWDVFETKHISHKYEGLMYGEIFNLD